MDVDVSFDIVGITEDHRFLVDKRGFKLGMPNGLIFNKERLEAIVGYELPYVKLNER